MKNKKENAIRFFDDFFTEFKNGLPNHLDNLSNEERQIEVSQYFMKVISKPNYSILNKLFNSYIPQKGDPIRKDMIIEPYIGDPFNEDAIPIILHNPGPPAQDLQDWVNGKFIKDLMKIDNSYSYYKFACLSFYSSVDWEKSIDPQTGKQRKKNRTVNNNKILAQKLFGSKNLLQLELFPWHSDKFDGHFENYNALVEYWDDILSPLMDGLKSEYILSVGEDGKRVLDELYKRNRIRKHITIDPNVFPNNPLKTFKRPPVIYINLYILTNKKVIISYYRNNVKVPLNDNHTKILIDILRKKKEDGEL